MSNWQDKGRQRAQEWVAEAGTIAADQGVKLMTVANDNSHGIRAAVSSIIEDDKNTLDEEKQDNASVSEEKHADDNTNEGGLDDGDTKEQADEDKNKEVGLDDGDTSDVDLQSTSTPDPAESETAKPVKKRGSRSRIPSFFKGKKKTTETDPENNDKEGTSEGQDVTVEEKRLVSWLLSRLPRLGKNNSVHHVSPVISVDEKSDTPKLDELEKTFGVVANNETEQQPLGSYDGNDDASDSDDEEEGDPIERYVRNRDELKSMRSILATQKGLLALSENEVDVQVLRDLLTSLPECTNWAEMSKEIGKKMHPFPIKIKKRIIKANMQLQKETQELVLSI